MVGEDLAAELLDEARDARALVDVVAPPQPVKRCRSRRRVTVVVGSSRAVVGHQLALPEARSDGFGEVAARDQVALVVDRDGQLRQRALGRAEDDLRPRA